MPPKKKTVQNKKTTPSKAKNVKKVDNEPEVVPDSTKNGKTDATKEKAAEITESKAVKVTTKHAKTKAEKSAEEATKATAEDPAEEAIEATAEDPAEEATEADLAEVEDTAEEAMEDEKTEEPEDEEDNNGDADEECEAENEGDDEENEPEEEAGEENGVEIIQIDAEDGADDDVIIMDEGTEGDAKKTGSDESKTEEKDVSWVDIIEKERDGKLHAELDKINKLISANQKAKEIINLAKTHRVHMYPVYPEDMANPFVVDVMKKCTQTNVRFCSSKNTAGEEEFTGFLELSFIRKKDLDDCKEKLQTLREGMKFLVGASKNTIEDFTNKWKTLAGLPGNADSNNKLTLFAPSLPESVTNDELWELFGKAREIWLVPGAPRQHAYIKFANEKTLQATIEELKARGPPRKEFSFCRLVRFYDVQRVIRLHAGPSRFRRDSAGTAGRISHPKNRTPRSPRDYNREKQRPRRNSPVPNKTAASLQSKDSQSSKDRKPETKTAEVDRSQKPKSQGPDKSKFDKPRPDNARSDKPKITSSSTSRDDKRPRRESRFAPASPVRRGNPPANNRNDRHIGNARRPQGSRPPMDRPPLNDHQGGRFHDDIVGSILGEPPIVPSLLGPPLTNNPSLEMSLNQLQRPMPPHMQPHMPQQHPGHQQLMHEDNQQQNLQVLDSLLSTLGQLSHQTDNPVKTLANVLQSTKGYDEGPRRGDRDERSYIPGTGGSAVPPRRDERRGRSPLKRAPSPRRLSPDMDIKRRREMAAHTTSAPMDRSQDYGRDMMSTLGQMSYRGRDPVDTFSSVLQSTKGYGEGTRGNAPDVGSYNPSAGSSAIPPRREERRGRSPMRRAPSPRRMSPQADMDMSRRQSMTTSTGTNRSQDYSRDTSRDMYNPAQPTGSIADAYKAVPRRTVPQAAQRRDNFADDFQRRTAPMSNMSNRGFDNLQQSRAPVDSYEQQSRQSRVQNLHDSNSHTTDYSSLRAKARDDITRMENEYAHLMNQITPQGNKGPSAGSDRPYPYY